MMIMIYGLFYTIYIILNGVEIMLNSCRYGFISYYL